MGRGLDLFPQGSRAFHWLEEGWRAFVGHSHLHVTVQGHWSGAHEGGELPLVQRPFPSVARKQDGSLVLQGEGFSALIAPDLSRIDIEGPDHPAVLQDVLRMWLAETVRRAGGILVHGVCVVHQGRAALFTGRSGAGKSTLGGLWRRAGGVLLADELVAVLPSEEGVTAWGTPWNVGTPGTGALTLLGTLAWDTHHSLRPQPPSAVLRTLAANLLLSDSTPAGKAEALRNAARVLSQVRAVELAFAQDTGVADVLREALEGA